MSKHELDEIAEKLGCGNKVSVVPLESGRCWVEWNGDYGSMFHTGAFNSELEAKDALLSKLRSIVGCDYAPLIEAMEKRIADEKRAAPYDEAQQNYLNGFSDCITSIKRYAKEQKQNDR